MAPHQDWQKYIVFSFCENWIFFLNCYSSCFFLEVIFENVHFEENVFLHNQPLRFDITHQYRSSGRMWTVRSDEAPVGLGGEVGRHA